MNKRILPFVLALLILTASMFMLSGCSGDKLSGKYLSVNDSSDYLIFDGNTVTLYENGIQTRSGKFRESAKASTGQYLLTITYEDSLSDERYWLDEKKEVIYDAIEEENIVSVGEIAFTNEK